MPASFATRALTSSPEVLAASSLSRSGSRSTWAALAELVARGVDASPVQHFDVEKGAYAEWPGGPWNAFLFFSSPDGNTWVLQERPAASLTDTGST